MASTQSGLFESRDLQFLLTFVIGMATFWLSGRIPTYVPLSILPHNRLALTLIGLTLALLIFGASVFLWNWLVLGSRRALRPVLAGTVTALVLALATSLYLTFGQLPHFQGQTGLALLTFILYLVYGIYYVIGWAVARRLAK